MSSIEASKVHVKKSLYKGQSNVMFWADSEMRFLKKTQGCGHKGIKKWSNRYVP